MNEKEGELRGQLLDTASWSQSVYLQELQWRKDNLTFRSSTSKSDASMTSDSTGLH